MPKNLDFSSLCVIITFWINITKSQWVNNGFTWSNHILEYTLYSSIYSVPSGHFVVLHLSALLLPLYNIHSV